ncbi:hypothetical protein Acr_04g0000880 [Actinidia rufa]|uniref:Uncharacterized protein n=1 Tax=Actinidia rufa TaxID=165716 RepID=A0A7J0EG38_9ERIC|nr:hypothetical protein Acr_04g0000880 [Actinidia rufa]
MPDEINQLPLPPPEESTPRDKLPNQGEKPGVDTHSSPTTEINTMTQENLNRLRESYSFPIGVQTRNPEERKTILSTRTGEVDFYEAAFPTESRVGLGVVLLQGEARRYNKLRILTDIEEQRTAKVFKKIGGYFNVLVVLGSRAFQRRFTLDRAEMSSSGGDNAEDRPIMETGTVGDEGESRHLRDELRPGDHTRDDSVEYIGTIKRSVRLLFRLPDQVFLSIFGVKVQPFFLNWETGSSSSSLSSSSGAMSESWLPFEDVKNNQFEEAHSREASNVLLSEAKSKGKKALPPPAAKKIKSATSHEPPVTKRAKPALALVEGTSANPGAALGPKASMLWSAAVAKKILFGAILPVDKEKADKLSLDQVVTKFFHIVGQVPIHFYPWLLFLYLESTKMDMVRAQNRTIELEGLLAEIIEKEKKAGEEHKTKSDDLARLEEEVAEITLAKGLIFEKATCSPHPNLGIDLDRMGLDHALLEEEEVEERENNKGEESPLSP